MRPRVTFFQLLLECLFGLHRQADGDLGGAVENLEHMIAQQAAELAFGAVTARQFDPPIARAAIRADDVGFSHVKNAGSVWFDLPNATPSQSNDRSEMALRRE